MDNNKLNIKRIWTALLVSVAVFIGAITGDAFCIESFAKVDPTELLNARAEEVENIQILIPSDEKQSRWGNKKSDCQAIVGMISDFADSIKESVDNTMSQYNPVTVFVFDRMVEAETGVSRYGLIDESVDFVIEYGSAYGTGEENQVRDNYFADWGTKIMENGVGDLIVSTAGEIKESLGEKIGVLKEFKDSANTIKDSCSYKVNNSSNEQKSRVAAYSNELASGTRSGKGTTSNTGTTSSNKTTSGTTTKSSSNTTAGSSSKSSSYKGVDYATSLEIRSKAQEKKKSATTKDSAATKDENSASTTRKISDVDPKYLDVSNWIGKDYDEVNSYFENVDIPSGISVELDSNNKISYVIIECPEFNALGYSPGSPFDYWNKDEEKLRKLGWLPDTENPGCPMPIIDEERARAKHYNVYTVEGELSIECDYYCLLKGDLLIGFVIPYPEGQTYENGMADYDHIYRVSYGKISY